MELTICKDLTPEFTPIDEGYEYDVLSKKIYALVILDQFEGLVNLDFMWLYGENTVSSNNIDVSLHENEKNKRVYFGMNMDHIIKNGYFGESKVTVSLNNTIKVEKIINVKKPSILVRDVRERDNILFIKK